MTSRGFRPFGNPPARGTPLTPAECELLGEWSAHRPLAGRSFALLKDGTFDGHWGACLRHGGWRGSWRRENDRLVLQGEASYLHSHSWPGPNLWGPDNRTEEYQVVTWGTRILLVDPGDLDLFVEDVNDGVERGQGENEGSRHRYSRERFETPAPQGLPNLPEPWKSRLLPGEIRGTILQVAEKRGKADIGRRDGVRKDMTLYVQAAGIAPWETALLTVVEVGETECAFEVTRPGEKGPLAAGQACSSWLIRPDPAGWPDYSWRK